jgi:hypothetical protein|tara:strand:- start:790 stop:957 length:168 start_codon:yes stop_codon:yes gene_type:complete
MLFREINSRRNKMSKFLQTVKTVTEWIVGSESKYAQHKSKRATTSRRKKTKRGKK